MLWLRLVCFWPLLSLHHLFPSSGSLSLCGLFRYSDRDNRGGYDSRGGFDRRGAGSQGNYSRGGGGGGGGGGSYQQYNDRLVAVIA